MELQITLQIVMVKLLIYNREIIQLLNKSQHYPESSLLSFNYALHSVSKQWNISIEGLIPCVCESW